MRTVSKCPTLKRDKSVDETTNDSRGSQVTNAAANSWQSR